jgi:cyclopropane fatty-acyl-phospholipid synthase-like methyltransferase
MLGREHNEKLFEYYNSPTIVAAYSQEESLSPCEQFLFDAYIKPGMAVLDIGVGGGRTSPYLAGKASRYVGIDYAPEMLQVCREKYPQKRTATQGQ